MFYKLLFLVLTNSYWPKSKWMKDCAELDVTSSCTFSVVRWKVKGHIFHLQVPSLHKFETATNWKRCNYFCIVTTPKTAVASSDTSALNYSSHWLSETFTVLLWASFTGKNLDLKLTRQRREVWIYSSIFATTHPPPPSVSVSLPLRPQWDLITGLSNS